ncbi:MAG: hypothetical protein IKM52_03395 [Clostridia bacterium]|nr:hypothetical protein [Clostridia bacterium]
MKTKDKRVFLFAGHYGSGKTNIAVNWAFHLRSLGKKVTVADLDIVNPYFRSKDSEEELRAQGIDLICSEYANTNLDIPALSPETYRLVMQDDSYAIFDVGGDDRGALALGRYTPHILEENRYEMWFVANFCRPLTQDAQSAYEVMREVETAGGIPFTGIINNTNIGGETTAETVLGSFERAEALSNLARVPIVMTTVAEPLLKSSLGQALHGVPNLFPLRLQKKYFDIGGSSLWQS